MGPRSRRVKVLTLAQSEFENDLPAACLERVDPTGQSGVACGGHVGSDLGLRAAKVRGLLHSVAHVNRKASTRGDHRVSSDAGHPHRQISHGVATKRAA